MCEYFVREETSNLKRVNYWREKFRKGEHFCEHSKNGEDFRPEHFKVMVLKKRVNRLISKLKKAREQKYVVINR